MLDGKTLSIRMAEERIKSEIAAVEKECADIMDRFDHKHRELSADERTLRRIEFLANRRRLGQLGAELLELRFAKAGV